MIITAQKTIQRTSFTILIIAVMTIFGSCEKDQLQENGSTNNPPVRKVRYELYTNEDFSGETGNIRFSLTMRNGVKAIFDSSLATMKIQDIPDSAHRIIIEKSVPGNNTSALTVGFNYEIENVGISWYLELFPTGDTLKVLRYSFK